MQGPSVGPIFLHLQKMTLYYRILVFVQKVLGHSKIVRHYVPGMENRRRCPDPYPAMTSPLAILFQIVSVVTGNSP